MKSSVDTKLFKSIDNMFTLTIRFTLLLASIIANIILYSIVYANSFGWLKTIMIFLFCYLVPIIFVTYFAKQKDTLKGHIKLCLCNGIYSIMTCFLHIFALKDFLSKDLLLPFLIIISILCFVFFAMKFEKTVTLLQQIRLAVSNIYFCYALFYLVDFTSFVLISLIIFAPSIFATPNMKTEN